MKKKIALIYVLLASCVCLFADDKPYNVHEFNKMSFYCFKDYESFLNGDFQTAIRDVVGENVILYRSEIDNLQEALKKEISKGLPNDMRFMFDNYDMRVAIIPHKSRKDWVVVGMITYSSWNDAIYMSTYTVNLVTEEQAKAQKFEKYGIDDAYFYFFKNKALLANGINDAFSDFHGEKVIVGAGQVNELIKSRARVNNITILPEIKKKLMTEYDYCVMLVRGIGAKSTVLMYYDGESVVMNAHYLTVLAEDYDKNRRTADEATMRYLQENSSNRIRPDMTMEEMAEINRKVIEQEKKNKKKKIK